MTDKMAKIRKWLKKNKIFFDTLAVIGIALMSIMLSYMSIQISADSNQIAFYETEIMKMQNQPIFQFDVNNIYHDSKYEEEQLIISNKGSPVSGFTSNYIVFLEITYYENGSFSEFVLIPIYDYYGLIYPSGNLSGEMSNLEGWHKANPKKWNYDEVKKANELFGDFAYKNNAIGHINILRFMKVRYTDIFGNTHNETYYIRPFGDRSYKLTKEDERLICNYYDEYFIYNGLQGLYMDQLSSPNLLYNKWLTFNKITEEQKINNLELNKYI